MTRAAATSDVFNAIAESRRREIGALLADGRARGVGEIVEAMDLAQPSVSKHLAVLRTVGVVTVERRGKNRLYALNQAQLKPIDDWIKLIERMWSSQLDRIKARAERLAKERSQRS